MRNFVILKFMLFFCYKTETVKDAESHHNPPSQNNKSCMLSIPMFIFLVSGTSIKLEFGFDHFLNKKMYVRTLVTYES